MGNLWGLSGAAAAAEAHARLEQNSRFQAIKQRMLNLQTPLENIQQSKGRRLKGAPVITVLIVTEEPLILAARRPGESAVDGDK